MASTLPPWSPAFGSGSGLPTPALVTGIHSAPDRPGDQEESASRKTSGICPVLNICTIPLLPKICSPNRVGVPPAEREAAIAKIKADQAGIDARISALLNRDDRERYAAFVAMERFRLIASWFNFDLLLKGKQTLSTVQAERLASALSAADAWARAQPGFVDFEFIAPEEITDTAVDTFTRQERAADSRALGEARAFLTGEQTAALSAYMTSIQESNEARLRLTARVLHPDAAPAAADAEE